MTAPAPPDPAFPGGPLVAVLVAPPGRLPPARAEALAARWAAPLRWLSPGEAAEIPLPAEPPDLWDVWAALQAEGIDLLPAPAGGRRKRVLLADMDSTIIGQECIDELAAEAGVGERVAAITARAMAGELGFEGALRERVALLAGLPEETVARVLATRIALAPGARTLVATMARDGARCVLVSGGFLSFARPVAAWAGFHEARANTLLAEDGRLTGRVAEPILGREAKAQTLSEVTASLGLGPRDALAAGDGANDLGMLGLAGLGVAVHAKPAVQARCRLRVNHADLSALLFLQGYARADFAA
ncbi:phosphoserine phosphatase SerB [Rubellimicrobium sp. CFH 75288]|uniref:phosphoserine phosphatase SerB n=1 Tax=Rubellimicrobium sp. CFH 75288 TaxID=2697034 RepID=UPI0014125A68|nr:phosphoserine phosphatase SerB [Rubellimicrobium sp. CFH 75288]NAZ37600.1 phosphoserine phosphatase SerB [Rubellimicrobium sp. CFH 75288]